MEIDKILRFLLLLLPTFASFVSLGVAQREEKKMLISFEFMTKIKICRLKKIGKFLSHFLRCFEILAKFNFDFEKENIVESSSVQ